MIIFTNKKTGDVIGVIEGREHSPEIIEKAWMQPSNVSAADIVKTVVPYEEIKETVHEEVTEQRVVDTKTMRVGKVVVGHKPVVKILGLRASGPLAAFIEKFEKHEVDIYSHKVLFDDKGKPRGFERKQRPEKPLVNKPVDTKKPLG